MSNFSALKNAVQQAIKQNGNEEITGAILQEILLSIINTLGDSAINNLETALQTETTNRTNADGTLQQNINTEATTRGEADTALSNLIGAEETARANADTALQGAITAINARLNEGYLYKGIATTTTNPSTPTGRLFYIATAAGTYTYFLDANSQPLVVTKGINILKYNGLWEVQQVIAIDETPIAGSHKLVESGGVATELALGAVYDVSAHNNNTTFESLNALLSDADLNTLIPTAVRKGGMSIKFVHSSDNKYVQCMLKAQTWSNNVIDWEKINIADEVEGYKVSFYATAQKSDLSSLIPSGSTILSLSERFNNGLLVLYEENDNTGDTFNIADFPIVTTKEYVAAKANGSSQLTYINIAGVIQKEQMLEDTLNNTERSFYFRADGNKRYAPLKKGDVITALSDGVTSVGLYETSASTTSTAVTSLPFTCDKDYAVILKYISGSPFITVSYKRNPEILKDIQEEVDIIEEEINDINIVLSSDYLDEKHSTFLSSNGITSAEMMKSFIKDFKMLIPRDPSYDYGILKVNNGLPSGKTYTYNISVKKWTKGETPSSSNSTTIASYSVASNPQNGEIILGDNVAKVDVDWSVLNTPFGGEDFFDGIGTGVRYNQNYIFGTSIPCKITELEENDDILQDEVDDINDILLDKPVDNWEEQSVEEGYFNTQGGSSPDYKVAIGSRTVPSPNTNNMYSSLIQVSAGDRIKITGKSRKNEYTRFWATCNNYTDRLRIRCFGAVEEDHRESPVVVEIQDGEGYIVVNLYQYDASTDKVEFCPATSVEKGLVSRVRDLENEEKVELFPETFIPSKIYGVIGDTLQIFNRGVVRAWNPYKYYNKFTCGQGKVYERYLEITPALVNVNNVPTVPTNLTVKHRLINDNWDNSEEKTAQLKLAARPTSSPSSNINVLCIGASTTEGGQWAAELKRRLTGTLDSGTPAADGLSNITFVGRKNGSVQTSVKVEATGGWNWSTFYTPQAALRFQVTGITAVNIGDKYSFTYTSSGQTKTANIVVAEVNVTGSAGNIRFLYNYDTTSGVVPDAASGTLTRVSGSGDSSITYSSYSTETYTPFYKEGVGCSFTDYVHDYCNDDLDVAIFMLGSLNSGILGEADITTMMGQMKTMLDALHRDFPNCKAIISTPMGLNTHYGMEYNYGANSEYTQWAALFGEFRCAQAYSDFVAQNDYKDWCFLANPLGEVDSENVFPTSTKAVNTRMTETEIIGTNGAHPNNPGYFMTADSVYRCFVNEIL